MRIQNEFKLYVRCMTYNQCCYIKDAMDGFVMQKTSFPFVCCITDDASTDGEQEVIKKYVNNNFNTQSSESFVNAETEYGFITYAPHKENCNCYFLVMLLKENHYQKGRGYERTKYIQEWIGTTKYVAYCEGDDYWVYPKKLQIQIDYLESHPNVTVSCHRCFIRREFDGVDETALRPFDEDMSRYKGNDYFEYDFETFFSKGQWINETNATVTRNIYDPNYWSGCKYTRDVHMNFFLLKKGNGVCHSFLGGVYRMNKGGMFSSLGRDGVAKIQNDVYSEIYNKTKEELLLPSIVHFRFAMICSGQHQLPFDVTTLRAWNKYFKYILKTCIHSLIPKRYRRSLNNKK